MMQYVEFRSGPNTLRGMLHVPAGQGPFPAVAFCHGFTGHRIEAHCLFVTIARRLEALGIASLRFDFAGSGESDGEFADMTMSGELDDAEAALDFLRGCPGVDPGRIGLIGLSLGGGVAALLLGRRGADVRAVALLSAVANPARVASFIRTGKFETQLAQWGFLDMHGLKVSRAFLQDLDRLDPLGAAGGYGGPILIVHGGLDETVPLSEPEAYRQARAEGPAGTTRLEVIAEADHTFNSIEHTERVCELLEGFFREQL